MVIKHTYPTDCAEMSDLINSCVLILHAEKWSVSYDSHATKLTLDLCGFIGPWLSGINLILLF